MTATKKTKKRATKKAAKKPAAKLELPGLQVDEEPIRWADIKAGKKRQREVFRVTMDAQLRQARDEALKERDRVQTLVRMAEARGDVSEDLKARLSEAEAAADEARDAAAEAEVPFVFEALGRQEYEDLQAAHPPTPAQKKEFKEELRKAGRAGHGELPYNSETFPPVLIAACLVSPIMTEEEAVEMWDSDDWSTGELTGLLTAAQAVNQSFG